MTPAQPTDRRERADRILDVTSDLLLRWGARRVSIDEVAKRAGVGKGTVYLHWRSREQLFAAAGAREAAAMADAIAAAIRDDPAEVALHRVLRRMYVEAMARPILRAIYTQDSEVFDKVLAEPARQPLQAVKLIALREYLGLLAGNGLLRDGLDPENVDYPLTATLFGFFAAEPFLPDGLALGVEDKADQLAMVLHRAFEPTRPPVRRQLRAVGGKAADIFTQWASDYRTSIYGDD
ncbi:TetR/AcrR family transcriptional regulator [Flindersiella endophytica]